MKKFLVFLVCLIILSCALPAFAQGVQRYSPEVVVNYIGTSTNCAGGAATNIAKVIDCRRVPNFNLMLTAKNNGAGTANLGVYIRRSVDGTRYDTDAQLITWPAAGNADATLTTNINTFGCGYIQISAFTNAAAATVNTTNLVIKWGDKRNAL